jgi:hypothetical protein
MTEIKQLLNEKKAITPLWIVALFVSLTELVLGVAVTQTQDGIQISLTAFVIIFPVLIATMFFVILWFKPYVFYPPTEFGNQTSVMDYVNAMKGKSLGDTQLHNIEEAIYSAVRSESVISQLSKTLSSQNKEAIEKNVEQILNNISESAVKKIQEVNFIIINTTPLLKGNGKIWHEPYDPNELIGTFTDILYFKMRPEIPPFTYGSRWIIKDQDTGKLFTDLGGSYPNDKRILSEVGIKAGMKLQIVDPKKQK